MFILLALGVLGCRRDATATGGPADTLSVEEDAGALPSSLPGLPPVAINLVNGRRYGVQLYAGQDVAEATARLKSLEDLGYSGAVLRADLGDKGVWHRVVVGDLGRRDLAELLGQRAIQDPRVRAVLPPVAEGEPAFVVRDDLSPVEVAPRAARAALQLAAGQTLQASLVRLAPGQPRGLLVQVSGDARARPVDASGTIGAPWPAPSYPGCAVCTLRAASSRARAVRVLMADDLAGDAASEVLLEFELVDGTRLASLFRAGPAAPTELLGFVITMQDPNLQTLTSWAPVEVDGDAGAELRLSADRLITHEGDLCQVERQIRIVEIDDGGARVVDGATFEALARAPLDEARPRFDKLVAAAGKEPQLLQVLIDAAGFLAADSTAGDVDIQRTLFRALDATRGPRAPYTRLAALARLVALRSEFRVTLAPRLLKLLEELLADRRVSIDVRGCDELPLERSGSWTARQRERWVDDVRHALDPRALPAQVFADLAAAYGPTTPVGLLVDELVSRLQPAAPAHAAVRQAMDRARSGVR
ncbi:MAG: SPOR domain-containing protein [Pseudomonadota bacterium]